MIFTSAPLYADPSNWNQQPPQAQDGSDIGGATGSNNYAIQLPPDFTLPSNLGANYSIATDVTDSTPLTTNPVSLNKAPHLEPGLKCPRCFSTNTKFCYFNNYSLSQPRHFCRTCRRYWTRGGTLRNVPVGGGSRRNSKRSKSSSSNPKSTRDSSKALPSTCQIGTSSFESDVGATSKRLGFPDMNTQPKLSQFPFMAAFDHETAIPIQIGASNHLGLDSRYEELLCGSNGDGRVGASTGSNNSGFQSGLPSFNSFSRGNIFP